MAEFERGSAPANNLLFHYLEMGSGRRTNLCRPHRPKQPEHPLVSWKQQGHELCDTVPKRLLSKPLHQPRTDATPLIDIFDHKRHLGGGCRADLVVAGHSHDTTAGTGCGHEGRRGVPIEHGEAACPDLVQLRFRTVEPLINGGGGEATMESLQLAPIIRPNGADTGAWRIGAAR